jgi:ABC-2 type transport system permease protein
VAGREVRERFRSRVFKVGTLIILAVVAAAVVIPVLRGSQASSETVAVVGGLPTPLQSSLAVTGESIGVTLHFFDEPSLAAARTDLVAGRVGLVIVDGQRLLVKRAISPSDTSDSAEVVRVVASEAGLQLGLEHAGLPAAEAAQLSHPAPLPVASLQPAQSNGTARVTATYGLILIFVLLSQYGTWIIIGVVEEKSSRVVEVLLASISSSQLLTGKVLGIGTLALAQAAAIVAVALGLAAAVGSDLVKGAVPLDVVSILVWLVLGYSFNCWVYAAGGALADRQEHVQTLAFPLQLPTLFGYIVSLTALGSSNPSFLVHVLAYIPPTAPFAMTVLVADHAVTWWQYALAVAVSIVATFGVARFAAGIYSRAVLRTGRRVRISEVLSASSA